MKKTTTANTKKYSVEVYFQLGEVACPYTLKLTDEQVRKFWNDAADEIIPADMDVCEVIQTEEDWAYVADAASEHLFNFICDKKTGCPVESILQVIGTVLYHPSKVQML